MKRQIILMGSVCAFGTSSLLAQALPRVGILTAEVASPGTTPAVMCESLASTALPQAKVTTAKSVPAGPYNSPGTPQGDAVDSIGLPAHCAVTATLRPSRDSDIRMELWLPTAAWNGKLMMVGNSEWGGSISYQAMIEPLRRGYAVASTDTGHRGMGSSFAISHPEKLVDFAYRAVHETALKAKVLTTAYYGRVPRYAYWNGGAAGGRQGLKEVQMYPADFDGVVVGAPNNNWMRQEAQSLLASSLNLPPGASAPILGAAQLAILHQGVLDQCDANDRSQDRQLQDPRSCDFSAASLVCKPGEATGNCLTSDQAQVADRIYAPLGDPETHELIYPGMPPGSELNWGPIVSKRWDIAVDTYALLLKQSHWNPDTPNLSKDIRSAELADVGIDAATTDLSAFAARGGKIIQFNGWGDPIVLAANGIDYFERVASRQGGIVPTQQFYRLFLIPAMGHFADTYTFDWITPIEQWVERGRSPDMVLANHIPPPGVTLKPSPPGAVVFTPEYGVHTMCTYPSIARLQNGTGEDPVDWLCQSAARGARSEHSSVKTGL